MGRDQEGNGSQVTTRDVTRGKDPAHCALEPNMFTLSFYFKAGLSSPLLRIPGTPSPASRGFEPHTTSTYSLLLAPLASFHLG